MIILLPDRIHPVGRSLLFPFSTLPRHQKRGGLAQEVWKLYGESGWVSSLHKHLKNAIFFKHPCSNTWNCCLCYLGTKKTLQKVSFYNFFQGRFRVGIFEIDDIEFSDTMHLSFFKVMDWQFSAPTQRKDFWKLNQGLSFLCSTVSWRVNDDPLYLRKVCKRVSCIEVRGVESVILSETLGKVGFWVLKRVIAPDCKSRGTIQ